MLRLHILFWFQNRVTAFGGRERHCSLPILAVIKQMFSDFYFTLPCLGAILFVKLWPEQRQLFHLNMTDTMTNYVFKLSWLRSHVATLNIRVLFINKNKPKKVVTLSVLFAVFTSRTKLACVL